MISCVEVLSCDRSCATSTPIELIPIFDAGNLGPRLSGFPGSTSFKVSGTSNVLNGKVNCMPYRKPRIQQMQDACGSQTKIVSKSKNKIQRVTFI